MAADDIKELILFIVREKILSGWEILIDTHSQLQQFSNFFFLDIFDESFLCLISLLDLRNLGNIHRRDGGLSNPATGYFLLFFNK